MLSVGATPARRDAAFNALKRIPALTPDAMARVPQAKLEAAVALAGPRKDERVRALRAGAEQFRRNPPLVADLESGNLGRAVRAASRVPHLGRAAALRLILFSTGHPVLPLDEHALRVARRVGYGADHPHPRRMLRLVRQALMRESGREAESLKLVAQYLSHHGIATCTDASPHCNVCPLAPDCEWVKLQ